MKVNLTLGGAAINGFVNLDPLAQPNQQDRIAADPTNLDGIIDNNEVTDFIAENMLDFLPLQIRFTTLSHWLGKLSHGGTIVVTAMHLPEVSRLLFRSEISDTQTINKVLYNMGGNVWTMRKSVISVEETIQMIMHGGQMNIEMVKFEGINYIIKAKRK